MKTTESVNGTLARIFHEMAGMYRLLGDKDRFRALAYENASRTIRNLPDEISHYTLDHHLKKLSGIGESIEEKILEFLETGKIRKYEEMKEQVPYELIELIDISGLGPQTLTTVHEKLHINTKDELIEALNDGRLEMLKGFGKKKVENLKRALKLHKVVEERMLLGNAWQLGEKILNQLKALPMVLKAELAGSLRRGKETIGDIDIIIASNEKDRKKIMELFTGLKEAERVLARGETKASIIVNDWHRQVDLRIVNENEWGSALLYFTGSKEHNIHLRTMAKDRGMKISEYGLFDLKSDKRIAGSTEEEMYRALGLQFIPAEMREDSGEIELAAKKKIPKLIQFGDIRGDLQMHSTWSDGSETIETIAEYVLKHFDYDYIVITDHSRSSRIAGGLDVPELRKQFAEIEEVNRKLKKDFVKKGVEVDILPDGSLDLPDDLLREMDWVTASIHSGFKKDNTDRLIRACENPYVNCIGHPSGILLGQREAYPVNWSRLFIAAKVTGTALEINAQQERLDLSAELARKAALSGIALVISTDAHTPAQFDFMRLGVMTARRGWCTASQILNTGSWNELAYFRKNKIRNYAPPSSKRSRKHLESLT
jgi:DNA polymerase (family 10)